MEMQLTITIDPVEFRNQRELLFQLAGCLASADGVEGLISLTDNIADAMSAAGETRHEVGAASTEVCYECGHSVAWGSGKFVNRIPADMPAGQENWSKAPHGEWLCAECHDREEDD